MKYVVRSVVAAAASAVVSLAVRAVMKKAQANKGADETLSESAA
jgi:hypothetical protein